MPLAFVALALVALAGLAPTAGAQTTACMESGLGLYHRWHTLRYRERVRLCRELDRQDRLHEWDAARLRQHSASDPEWLRWRQEECLVNAAACDIPGVHTAPLSPPAPPPPPPPPPVR